MKLWNHLFKAWQIILCRLILITSEKNFSSKIAWIYNGKSLKTALIALIAVAVTTTTLITCAAPTATGISLRTATTTSAVVFVVVWNPSYSRKCKSKDLHSVYWRARTFIMAGFNRAKINIGRVASSFKRTLFCFFI